MIRTNAISYICALVSAFMMVEQRTSWPTVKTIEVTRSYDLTRSRPKDTPLLLILRDVSNEPAYRLECHNGDYDVESGYNYSGDFQCMLWALKGRSRVSGNLLATDNPVQRGSGWMNRGRMLASQLYGACGDVPDYGRTRRFRLRHMQLTIQFANLRWRPGTRPLDPILDGFTVRVRVSPDASAQTKSAAPAPLKIDPEPCQFMPGG